MADITLFEEVNLDKLREVIACNNIPFKNTHDTTWVEQCKKRLALYAKKKYKKQGFEIRYTQPNKFGRFITKCGLQNFQKDVRKYISGEFVRDFDFVNCHPVLLEQLLKKNNIYCGQFLENYNNNRSETIEKYNLIDKTTLIKVINNDSRPSKELFLDLHDKIYHQLVPLLLKERNLKAIFNRIQKQRRKDRKDYNHLGSFLSHYLQHIENGLLISFYNYLLDNHIKVHSLCFDGLTVEKSDLIDNAFIKGAEKRILDETGFYIVIQEKSCDTDWKPVIDEVIDMANPVNDSDGIQFDREHLDSLVEDCFNEEGFLIPENCKLVVHYTNNFLCMFEDPFCFGFRFNTKNEFKLTKNKGDVYTVLGEKAVTWFMKYNCRLQFSKPVFIVDESDPELHCTYGSPVYNTYIRPPFKTEGCSQEEVEARCPLFFDFLKNLISNSDENLFNYLLHYIAKIVQVGRSEQSLVLKGKKGTGKSTFSSIVKLIVENYKDQYSKTLNDISTLMNKFNALDAKCIITTIEEVVTDAGCYHSVQNKLKDLITAESIRLERKGIDALMVPNQNNIIILTNNLNPVEITDDNRRYLIIYVPDHKINQANYFINLKKEVSENIEYIRGFFYQFQYENNLNRIRPVTQAELDLRELNKPAIVQFIQEEIDKYVVGPCNNRSRKFNVVYECYEMFTKNLQKKPLSIKYFSLYLKENGFVIERKGKSRYTFIYKTSETCRFDPFVEDKDDIVSEH